MPTGGGKSLCYQLPAMLIGGAEGTGADDTEASQPLTIVISPLVSLMTDQVEQMKQAGMAAEQITSSTSKDEQRRIYSEVAGPPSGRSFRLLYVTPERVVQSGRFKGVLQKCGSRIDCFVIDEAHCIAKCGHDFRRDYEQLHILRSSFPYVPIMALTATAAGPVEEEVKASLLIPRAFVFRTCFNRANLFYSYRQKPSSQEEQLRGAKRSSLSPSQTL